MTCKLKPLVSQYTHAYMQNFINPYAFIHVNLIWEVSPPEPTIKGHDSLALLSICVITRYARKRKRFHRPLGGWRPHILVFFAKNT